MLDPARSGTFAGRIVFAAACDKRIDLDPSLAFVPELATSWAWAPDGLTLTLQDGVRFQDGASMDVEAVCANLDRCRAAPESVRKTELKSAESVDVADTRTVRLRLAHPDLPSLAVLADRAGMMLSPHSPADGVRPELPVCTGPFRIVRRVAQDRIELERFPEYWNTSAIHFDCVVFRPIVDSSVRLLNLHAGQLDVLEELAPTNVEAVQSSASPPVTVSAGEQAWPGDLALVDLIADDDVASRFSRRGAGRRRETHVERRLGVVHAELLAMVMVGGRIALVADAATLTTDVALQRRYLGVGTSLIEEDAA